MRHSDLSRGPRSLDNTRRNGGVLSPAHQRCRTRQARGPLVGPVVYV